MGVVKARVVLKGERKTEECLALVDTGAAITAVDKNPAEVLGVMYIGRKRSLVGSTGHKLEGEMAIIRELEVSPIELAGFIPDATTGRLRKIETFFF